MKTKISSPLSAFREDLDFHEIGSFDDWWHVDPFMFEYVMTEGLGLDYARVEFNAHVSSSVTEDKPCATNEVSMSDYCSLLKRWSLCLILVI